MISSLINLLCPPLAPQTTPYWLMGFDRQRRSAVRQAEMMLLQNFTSTRITQIVAGRGVALMSPRNRSPTNITPYDARMKRGVCRPGTKLKQSQPSSMRETHTHTGTQMVMKAVSLSLKHSRRQPSKGCCCQLSQGDFRPKPSPEASRDRHQWEV